MNTNELLQELQTHLNAATVADKGGREAECMYHLEAMQGLLIKFTGQNEKEPPKRRSSTND